MELTKEHRSQLLNELDKANEDAELQKTCLNNHPQLAKGFEIGHFLAIQRITLIKKALTENEIDY